MDNDGTQLVARNHVPPKRSRPAAPHDARRGLQAPFGPSVDATGGPGPRGKRGPQGRDAAKLPQYAQKRTLMKAPTSDMPTRWYVARAGALKSLTYRVTTGENAFRAAAITADMPAVE